MKGVYLLIVIFLVNKVSSVDIGKKSTNGELGYNPVELLERLFNQNITTESRESRFNKIKIEKDLAKVDQTYRKHNDYDEKPERLQDSNQTNNGNRVDEEANKQYQIESNRQKSANVDDIRSEYQGFQFNNEEQRESKVSNFPTEEPRAENRNPALKRQRKRRRKPRVQSALNQDNIGYNRPNHQQGGISAPNHFEIHTNKFSINPGHSLSLGPYPNAPYQYGLLPEPYFRPNQYDQNPMRPVAPLRVVPNGIGHNSDPYEGLYSGSAVQYPGYPYSSHTFIPRQTTSGAFSAIVNAFTSIAQNDDNLCVPRLLCEAAGGAIGSNKILDSVSNLQPLFAMLAGYQGLSASPLFLFGRAVFLGMTSKGNPSSCRYAYPQCPNDPDDLVYYLNNHKGGFFRFFNNLQGNQQDYVNHGTDFQSYGLYQPSGNHISSYGLYNGYKQYGQNYGYDQRNQKNQSIYSIDDNDNASVVQARIQNKPIKVLNENFERNSKWLFPDEVKHFYDDNIRIVKELKFPSDNDYNDVDDEFDRPKDFNRKGKTILFPDRNNDDQFSNNYNYYKKQNYQLYHHNENLNYEANDYVFDHIHNIYVKRENNRVNNQKEVHDGVNIVYIVRGNGDPNHPEVIKLRPGQTIQ